MPEQLTITVCFFAALREQLACSQLTLNMAASSTVKDILSQLCADHPHWQPALENNSLLMAVNHDIANETTLVNNGDEVAFFPPVTGG